MGEGIEPRESVNRHAKLEDQKKGKKERHRVNPELWTFDEKALSMETLFLANFLLLKCFICSRAAILRYFVPSHRLCREWRLPAAASQETIKRTRSFFPCK